MKNILECFDYSGGYYEPSVQISLVEKETRPVEGCNFYPKTTKEFINWYLGVLQEYDHHFGEFPSQTILDVALSDTDIEDIRKNVGVLTETIFNAYDLNIDKKFFHVLFDEKEEYGGFRQQIVINKEPSFIMLTHDLFMDRFSALLKKHTLLKVLSGTNKTLALDKCKSGISYLKRDAKQYKETIRDCQERLAEIEKQIVDEEAILESLK